MSITYWGALSRAGAFLPARRTTVAATPSGWADDRMMQAYDLIWEVMKANEPHGIKHEFEAVLRGLEAADELLIECTERMEA